MSVRVRLWVAVTLGSPLDLWVVASAVKVKVPGTSLAFGVPDRVPFECSFRPLGSEPLLLFHLYGVAPPVAWSRSL